MFIVKHRNDLVRFVIFTLLMGSMVYFVSGNLGTWLTSEEKLPAAAAVTTEPGATLIDDPVELVPEDEADYFVDARIHRAQIRAQFQEQLKELMASDDSTVRTNAETQYYELGRAAKLEAQAEQLVMAKGFEDVLVHLENGTAQVVVKAQSLTQPQAVQIIDLVSRVTGVKAGGVNVIPREK